TSQFRIRFDTLLNTISFVASAFTETGVESRVAKYVGQRTFAPSGIIDNNNRTVFDRPINLPNFNASPIVGDIWRNSAGTYLQYRNAAGVSRELSPRFWSESGDEISRVGRINVDVLSGSAFRFSLGNNSSNKYLTFYEDSSVTTNTGVLQFEYNSSISANVIRLSESGRYFDIISTADAKRLEIRNSISNYADSYFYPNVRTAVRPGLFMRRFDTSSGLETTFNTYTSMEGISVIYTTGGNTSSGDVHISTRNSSAISGDNNFQKRVTFDHQGNTILHTPTGVLKINVGTTAQAPATKQFGQLRGNSTTGRYTAVASDNTTVNNITTDNVLSDSLQRQRTYALVSQTGVDTTAADALQAINKLSLNAASRNFTITGDSAFVVAVAGVYRIDGKCRSAAPGAIGDYVHTFEVHVNNVAVNSTILSVTTNAGGQQFPVAGFATLAASDIVKFKIASGFEQIITTQQCSFIVELLKPN
ncbi:MAG TPA: hypothetical protein PKE68_10575, partial [Saprospiraceae bacterium]|nr:hypothetical protein [Saprospiraceae bacterium]